MTLLVAAVLAVMLAVMAGGWALQRATANGGWTDVAWTCGTGATCAAAAVISFGGADGPAWRQAMVAVMVGLWSLRLGTYVALRVSRGAEDARYALLRREWGARFQARVFGLAIAQAPVSALLAASVLLAAHEPTTTLRLADALGVAVLLGAVLGETFADHQMQRFKADPANRNRVCERGLWAWSRHPNYFFEFAGWLAYPVIAFDRSRPRSLAALVAPALMFVVLRYGTGVPPLEAAMLRSKGDAYRRYQARVSAFLLRRPRLSSEEKIA